MWMRPLAVFLLVAAIAGAQTVHIVKASGDVTITAKPDQAEILLGVETNAATAQAAASENAAEAVRVINTIKPMLGSGGQIQTTRYSITPVYDYPQGKPPALTGYRADNTVQVKIDDLALVGRILDAATRTGANRIEGITFTLRNDGSVRAQALAQAAQRARANAEAIANGLNLHVVRVLEAESDSTSVVRPLPQFARLEATEGATPVEAAGVEITATVTVTLEVQ